MSFRSCVPLVFAGLMMVGQVRAQDEEVLGKTRTEWLKILKEHKESKFRRAAVIALGVYGPRAAGVLPALLEALENDSDPNIRREIAVYLGPLGADVKGTVDSLAMRLEKDKNDKVREAAAKSLGKLAEFASIHVMALGRALKDPSENTRAAAAEALKSFGDKARIVLPQLLDAAQDIKMDRFTRLYAVQILSKQGGEDDRTAGVLVGIMSEKDAPAILRQAAANGLGTLGPAASSAVPKLAKLLENPKEDSDLRRAAAVALGSIGEKASSAWPTVKVLLRDADTGVRYQAVRLAGLVGKGNAEATQAMIDMLKKETNTEVLLAAIQELGELGAREALEPLTRITNNDTRQSIREAAEASLKKIKGS